jgi:hypothetical protein
MEDFSTCLPFLTVVVTEQRFFCVIAEVEHRLDRDRVWIAVVVDFDVDLQLHTVTNDLFTPLRAGSIPRTTSSASVRPARP